jgi:MFS family permease
VTVKGFSESNADPRRWLILATICTAALMIVLDVTVMNLALPSAQRTLGFTNADRQWIVTTYALSFGSLLLFCGRLADLIGRKTTFLTGLAGFAAASAVGGASDSFAMLRPGPLTGPEDISVRKPSPQAEPARSLTRIGT